MPLGGRQTVNLITRAHFTLLYEKEVSIQMQTLSRYKTIHINNLRKSICTHHVQVCLVEISTPFISYFDKLVIRVSESIIRRSSRPSCVLIECSPRL